MLANKTVQQNNSEVISFHRNELWEAIKNLRQFVDFQPCEPQLPRVPSVRSLGDTALDAPKNMVNWNSALLAWKRSGEARKKLRSRTCQRCKSMVRT